MSKHFNIFDLFGYGDEWFLLFIDEARHYKIAILHVPAEKSSSPADLGVAHAKLDEILLVQ